MDLNMTPEQEIETTEQTRANLHQQYLSEAEAELQLVDETPDPSLDLMVRALIPAVRAAMYRPSYCRCQGGESR